MAYKSGTVDVVCLGDAAPLVFSVETFNTRIRQARLEYRLKVEGFELVGFGAEGANLDTDSEGYIKNTFEDGSIMEVLTKKEQAGHAFGAYPALRPSLVNTIARQWSKMTLN